MSFTYDYTALSKGKGRLRSVGNNAGTQTFSYDAYGNITAINDMFSVSTYQYDSANRLKQITYPSGRIVIYTRNALGQITQVQSKDNSSAAAQTIISNAAYEPFGPLKSLTFGNGVTTTITHDADYRASRITTTSTPGWDYVYDYDAAGNLTSKTDQLGTQHRAYGYDTLNRLTNDNAPNDTSSFAYDAGGNRTAFNFWIVGLPYTYESTSNRMTAMWGSSISNDSAGNRTLDVNGTALTYNNTNRLSQSTASSVTTTYRYTGLGQRNAKLNAQNVHYDYLPDGKYLDQQYRNTDASFNQVFDYVWLDATPVAQIKTTYTSGTATARRLTYIHADYLNTPRLMTDSTKTVVWSWNFDAYGLSAPDENPDGDSVTDTLDLRSGGMLADSETGFFNDGFRYYDSLSGRFLTYDPIGLAGGLNPFRYALDNPVNYYDPDGLSPRGQAVGGAVGAVVGGGLGLLGGGTLGTVGGPPGMVFGGAEGAAEGAAAGAAIGSIVGDALTGGSMQSNEDGGNIIQFPGSINPDVPNAGSKADPKYCPSDDDKYCDAERIKLANQYGQIANQTWDGHDTEFMKRRHNMQVDAFNKKCAKYAGKVPKFWISN